MFYDLESSKWILQSLRDPKMFIRTVEKLPEDLPIGTHDWEIPETDALCKKKIGDVVELTMSQCYPNMYTCNNGDCITLRYKDLL